MNVGSLGSGSISLLESNPDLLSGRPLPLFVISQLLQKQQKNKQTHTGRKQQHLEWACDPGSSGGGLFSFMDAGLL